MDAFLVVKFLRFIRKGDKNLFDISQQEQQVFLEKMSIPTNDIQRSLNQYKCQKFFWSSWKVPVFNIGAMLLFFPILLLECVRSLLVRRAQHVDAVSELKGMEEVVPSELMEQYDVMFDNHFVKGILKIKDIPYILKIFFVTIPNTFFSLKIMMRIGQYCELIHRYSPNAFITHGEFSFASSILTEYCEKHGIKHINVMHGEKLYHIYDSFFRFTKCYVWADYYKELFLKLKAYPKQFEISVPPSLEIDIENNFRKEVYADFKYYLADFNDAEIERLIMSVNKLKRDGKTVKYRLHPRYLKIETILKYVSESEIENPKEVTIQESVASCAYAVGSYSTVLAQAFFSGKKVILDDVTNYKQYEKLSEYGYWLNEYNCLKLSQIIKKSN